MTALSSECGSPGCVDTGTRPYMTGPCCPLHTPARVAGRPEPDSLVDPALTLNGLLAASGRTMSFSRGDTALLEQRAHDKGQAVSAARRALWREAS